MASCSLLEVAYTGTRERIKQEETAKYAQLWAAGKYGTPETCIENIAPRIVAHIETLYPHRGDKPRPTAIDFGAGNGAFLHSLMMAGAIGAHADAVDLILPPNVPAGIRYHKQALWEPVAGKWGFALSTDALEHLPTTLVSDALKAIRCAAPHGFLRIATRPDKKGAKIGQVLHLTVQPYSWWLAQLAAVDIVPSKFAVEVGEAVEVFY